MWSELEKSGSWSGELLCQYKNGVSQAEWLTVNAVVEAHDAMTGKNDVVSGYHFIFSDIAERHMAEEKLREVSQHDGLTHLPNRTMFADNITRVIMQAEYGEENWALVYINLDRFVEINNALGVTVGDEVLFTVGQILLGNAGGHDLLCRMGGDEFAVLIMGEGRDSIEQKVVSLSQAIEQPIQINDREIQLRVSIGIGVYPADGKTYEELVRSAGIAMSHARLTGGDTYLFFDKSLGKSDERQITLRQGFKSGLHKNEFYMVYQPKYSLGQGRVVGAEALVRWKHPSLGIISPVEFIPIAESCGAVIELSEWIIDTVCAQIAEWQAKSLPAVPVSINISPVHFWRGDLVGSLQSGLNKWGILPKMLPIEVTEGVVMDTSENTLQLLAQLKALGFHLSIDDFGTGYSSLKYLRDLPVSELKIDRSFIIQIPEEGQPGDISKTAILRAIIHLAAEFNLAVVAEGVETEHQKKFLIENGCDVIQGYLFSKPIPANEFALMLT